MQRPLATVIVWGLFSSTTLTLFVVPVFYRILVPALPRSAASAADSEAEARSLVEPLPDVSTADIVGLLEHLHARGGEEDVFHICDETNREFARVIAVVKAAEMLGFIETPGHLVVLTAKGKAIRRGRRRTSARPCGASNCSRLRLFRDVYEVIRRSPEHAHRPRFRAGDDRDADALRELREDLQHLHPLVPLRRAVCPTTSGATDFAGVRGGRREAGCGVGDDNHSCG